MLTANEIKKALKCCYLQDRCTDCPFMKVGGCNENPAELAIDLISHLEAEKEGLEKENKKLLLKLCKKINKESKVIENHIKAEAYEELASEFEKRCMAGGIYPAFVKRQLENVKKELTNKSAE